MSAKIETSIWLALKARIEDIPLGLTFAWPGQTFTPTYSGAKLLPYLRIGRVTNAPVSMLIANGKPHERNGRLIVTLVHPLGNDVAVYDQMAATIAEHFIDGTQMPYGRVCVSVPSYPHVQEGYEDNGYWTVPVSIPWRCFA